MARLQRQIISKDTTKSRPKWTAFAQKNWMPLAIAGGGVLVIVLAIALQVGMRRNAEYKASALFFKAETVQDYQTMLKKYPHSRLVFGARMNLANLLQTQGDLESATAVYEQSYKQSPDGFQGASALCALGMLHAEKGDIAKAGELLRKAVEVEPAGAKAAEALFQWGRVLQSSGDLDGARTTYQLVLQQFPGGAWAREASSRISSLKP
jgi:TolA-binding protein